MFMLLIILILSHIIIYVRLNLTTSIRPWCIIIARESGADYVNDVAMSRGC